MRRRRRDVDIEPLWEHLQNTATDEERAAWAKGMDNVQPRGVGAWLRRRFGSLNAQTGRDAPDHVVPAGEGFFAAAPEQIDDAVVEHGPFERFPIVEVKMLSEISVAQLGELLGAGEYESLREAMDRSARSGEDCGLYRVPTAIRDAAAAATDIDRVANAWIRLPEQGLDEWRADDARALLEELRELASQAYDEGKQLWVWWSL